MRDITPLLHAASALAVQAAFGLYSRDWVTGGLLGSLWFIAREHTQAEYRWIVQFGAGKRANMPWWGGFSWRAWNLPSLLDCLVPVLACAIVHFVSTL